MLCAPTSELTAMPCPFLTYKRLHVRLSLCTDLLMFFPQGDFFQKEIDCPGNNDDHEAYEKDSGQGGTERQSQRLHDLFV